jgi:hypothetical protein
MTSEIFTSDEYQVSWETESFRKSKGIVTAGSSPILIVRLTRLDGTLDVYFETPAGNRIYRAHADRQHGMWGTYSIDDESTGECIGYVEKHAPRLQERWEIRNSADIHVADIQESTLRGVLTRQLNMPARWTIAGANGNDLGEVIDDFRLWEYSFGVRFDSPLLQSDQRRLLLLGTIVRYSRLLQ